MFNQTIFVPLYIISSVFLFQLYITAYYWVKIVWELKNLRLRTHFFKLRFFNLNKNKIKNHSIYKRVKRKCFLTSSKTLLKNTSFSYNISTAFKNQSIRTF